MALPEHVLIQTVEYVAPDGEFRFRILRLDLIHPITGGNKWFKLIENIREFQAGGYQGILSFGGAYSNHIAALAGLGQELGIPTVGIIRGESLAIENPTLSRASQCGMTLEFVSRDEYRRYRESDCSDSLFSRFGNVLVIPEGGSNAAGVAGCRYIAQYMPEDSTDVVLAVGTGATLTGIRQALSPEKRVWGVKVLEANQQMSWNNDLPGPVEWVDRFTFGGYAKTDPELLAFVDDWNRQTGVVIEPVYTGKLFFGVIWMMREGRLKSGEETLVVHTGGLQYLRD